MGALDNTPGLSVGVAAGWSELLKKEVLAELERVLASHQFRTSKKCSRFLGHIIQAALEGRFDRLKERTLGIDVFGREPHYDTNQDPIVRGTAGEVRKRLAQYYLEAGTGELRFSLPPGSYVPEAHYVTPERPVGPVVLTRPHSEALGGSRTKVVGAGIGILCVVAATGLWLLLRPAPLDRFWEPVLTQSSVLVCMGQPQLYTFHSDTARVLNSWFTDASVDRGISPPITAVPLNEIIPMWDTPVALADTQAFSRLASLFAQKRTQADVRGDRSVSLSELRGKPSVFIGAFDNHWTLSLAGELRFYFDTDEKEHTQLIRDRQRPGATDWKLVDAWPPRRDIAVDYALVTRVVNRTTERSIVILGGIAQFGTEAAAEFVTDPAYFQSALAQAPADWYRKNMQVVLSTRVFSGAGGPPRVVATYFW
jgi:hypothetical protein